MNQGDQISMLIDLNIYIYFFLQVFSALKTYGKKICRFATTEFHSNLE